MKYLLLILTGILFYCNVYAQHKQPVVFNSYNSIGFVAGKSPVALAAQTENGVKYNNWFLGAGFGMDNYFIKTLPLYLAVKKEFSVKKNSLFLYVNAGGNFIAKDKETKNGFTAKATKGGFYADAGAGYKIKTTNRSSIYFSIGNSVKQIRQAETSLDTGFPYTYETKYKLSRIAFKAGYQF